MASSTATIIPTTTSTALVALTEKRASERYATDSNVTALGLTKTQLRESLAKLMETRTLQDAKLWSSRTSVTGPLAKAVEQYYVMFGHGLVVPGKNSVPAAQEAHDLQVGFLHNYMDQDVRFGESSGRSVVYEQWRSYALVHAAMQVAMTSAEVTQATGDAGDENATTEVVAKGILKLNLDRATLQYVFPRVLADEVLVQQLVGKEVVYDTFTTYIFNAAGQVVSQDLAIDFQSGFRKLLGDDALAAKLLGDSLIYDSVKIQVVDGETEGEA